MISGESMTRNRIISFVSIMSHLGGPGVIPEYSLWGLTVDTYTGFQKTRLAHHFNHFAKSPISS